MASKKQQERRAKAKRHGLGRHAYEYVLVDEEGNEIEAEPRDDKQPSRAPAKGSAKRGGGTQKPRRQPKAPQPPSLKRLGKRGALFLPVILLLTLSQKNVSVESRIFQAILFAIVFVAIMWGSDHLVYKMWLKRQAKEKDAGGGKGPSGGSGKG